MSDEPVLTRAEVRRVDEIAIRDFGIPGVVLMENAARGCVDALWALNVRGPVAIACGRGNNAGDGFAIARRLATLGIASRLLLFGRPDDFRGDAAVNFAIVEKLQLPRVDLSTVKTIAEITPHLSGCDCVLDALLGTGAQGAPRPPFDLAIRALNAAAGIKFAVDLPSGLDCDTGLAAEPTFRADHTGTFVAAKPGLRLPAAQPYVGQLHVIDIGVPYAAVADKLRA